MFYGSHNFSVKKHVSDRFNRFRTDDDNHRCSAENAKNILFNGSAMFSSQVIFGPESVGRNRRMGQ